VRVVQQSACEVFQRTAVTLFAFSVIATLPTSTRPQIPEETNADCAVVVKGGATNVRLGG